MKLTCDGACEALLVEALDLSIRARKIDAQIRTSAALSISADPEEWIASGKFDLYVTRHNSDHPDEPLLTKGEAIPPGFEEQYREDLAEWEKRVRNFLMPALTSSKH